MVEPYITAEHQATDDDDAKVKDIGNGNAKGKSKAKDKQEEPQKIISKSQVYKLGDNFLAEAVLRS